MADGEGVLVTLERWRSTLFLLGAVALFVLAGSFAAEALTDMTIENHLITGAAWAIVFLGYLGLYTELSDRSRWLARAAGVCATFGFVGFGFMFLKRALENVGIVPAEVWPAWIGVLIVLPMVGINVGPLLFGVTSLRTGVYSQTFGLLLLIPSLLYYVNIARAVLKSGNTNPAVTTVLVLGYTVVVFSVGYILRDTDAPTNRSEKQVDPMV